MVVARSGQFAQGKPFQFVQLLPLLQADRDLALHGGFLHVLCHLRGGLPGFIARWWQRFGFSIGHGVRQRAAVFSHGRELAGLITPTHQLLPLRLAHGQPMVQF